MRYVPRVTLWKALLVGLILLCLVPATKTQQKQRSGVFPVRAADHTAAQEASQTQLEDGHNVYLPFVYQPPRIELTEAWTADDHRTPREAFLPGKVIRFYGSGFVNIPDASTVRLRWSVIGPCGSKILFDGSGQINQGKWTLYESDTAPNCPGIYTYTLRMEYQNEITFDTVSYAVNNPSEVISMNLQGFDKCNIPYGSKTESINQMQTWWNLSPYYSVNLYIGGVSRYCSNTELDAVWVNRVAQQGWSFIPTWVGPQAPCTSYRYKFSSSPFTAYQQGISEANAAVEATRNLGLLGNTVIYYDLEMYSTTNLSCREAADSFLAGWTQRLREQGVRSGVYGHRINANDWAAIYPSPDNAWIASWVRSYYDPNITAYGIPGISNDLWLGRRIRQYAGDHVEAYGGHAFSIDSNIMDGEVTVLPGSEHNASASFAGGVVLTNDTSSVSLAQVQNFQLVSGEQGWALVDHQLYWTGNAGSTWSDITPASSVPGSIMAVHFVDEKTGWIVTQDPITGDVDVLLTGNTGMDWVVSRLIDGSAEMGPIASAAYLDFLDNQIGWVIVKLISSANFSNGRLYHTQDGGLSWSAYEIPLGEPVHFLDPLRGWVAGGPAGNQLFYTEDAGRSWQEQHDETWPASHLDGPVAQGVDVSSGEVALSLTGDLPEGVVKVDLKPDGLGWAHIEMTECSGIKKLPYETDYLVESFSCEKQSKILGTSDGGQTWVDITP
jgi:photosystem II stability/assembly factor-like uncharacterized protein